MKITKTEFLCYEQLRRSGITNMFDVNKVKLFTGMNNEQVFYVMLNYEKLSKKYIKENK